MTSITKAEIHEHSITLWLCDKDNNYLGMTIPCASRKDRADLEERLLTAGVQVTHPNELMSTQLYAAYQRQEAARARMNKAHENATCKEFDNAKQEWSQACDAYNKLANS